MIKIWSHFTWGCGRHWPRKINSVGPYFLWLNMWLVTYNKCNVKYQLVNNGFKNMNSWLGKNKFCGLKMQVFLFNKGERIHPNCSWWHWWVKSYQYINVPNLTKKIWATLTSRVAVSPTNLSKEPIDFRPMGSKCHINRPHFLTISGKFYVEKVLVTVFKNNS